MICILLDPQNSIFNISMIIFKVFTCKYFNSETKICMYYINVFQFFTLMLFLLFLVIRNRKYP